MIAAYLKDVDGFAGNFRTDAVSSEDGDLEMHALLQNTKNARQRAIEIEEEIT